LQPFVDWGGQPLRRNIGQRVCDCALTLALLISCALTLALLIFCALCELS
jgi:hypothetical protein